MKAILLTENGGRSEGGAVPALGTGRSAAGVPVRLGADRIVAVSSLGEARSRVSGLGEEPFWLVRSWAAEFDPAPVLALHRARGAAVTLALREAGGETGGLRLACDRLGRVVYCEEDPPLARCAGLAAWAGAALCAPVALRFFPAEGGPEEGLFPALMDRGLLWGAQIWENFLYFS